MEVCSDFISGNFGFFIFREFNLERVPFNVDMNVLDGILNINTRYINLIKNMMESYSTCVDNYSNKITGEIQTLKLYKTIGKHSYHNVFTSIYFVLSVSQPIEPDKLVILFCNQLSISDLSIINCNFNSQFNKNNLVKRLVIIETKIYFWWKIFNQSDNNNNIFSFYLWCFRNLSNLDRPILPGSKTEHHIGFPDIFNKIKLLSTIEEHFNFR